MKVEKNVEDIIKNKFSLLDYNISYCYNCDGLINNVLIEFKNNITNILEKTLAQGLTYLYYIRNGKNGKKEEVSFPLYLLCCDDNTAYLLKTDNINCQNILKLHELFLLSPSSPSIDLIDKCKDLVLQKYDLNYEKDISTIKDIFKTERTFLEKLDINQNNVKYIFSKKWCTIFNGFTIDELIEFFMIDICEVGEYDEDKSKIAYSNGKVIVLNLNKHRNFWNTYNKVKKDSEEFKKIISIKHTLNEISTIRNKGAYYTPLSICEIRFDKYLLLNIPNLLNTFKYVDFCAGTGNMEIYIKNKFSYKDPITKKIHSRMFISTKEQEDYELCLQMFPDVNVFKTDFLFDDYEQFDKRLKKLFSNEKTDWLFDINPPYNFGTSSLFSRVSKSSVSSANKFRKSNLNVGFVQRDTGIQFLLRIIEIIKKFELKNVYVGTFIPSKWFEFESYNKFVKVWTNHFKFISGFTFDGERYEGAEGKWLAGYFIWKYKDNEDNIIQNEFVLDYYNKDNKLTDKKIISIKNNNETLSLKKFLQSKNNIVKNDKIISNICMSNTFKVKEEKDSIKISNGYSKTVAFYYIPDRLENAGRQFIVSWSDFLNPIHLDDIEEHLSAYTAQIIISPSKNNITSSLQVPEQNSLHNQFKKDSVIYSLFSAPNHTSSILKKKNDKIYSLRNNMFILSRHEISLISEISDYLMNDFLLDNHESVLVEWLISNQNLLSEDARIILQMGKELFIKSFAFRKKGLWSNSWKEFDSQILTRYDAGWFQLTRELKFGNNKIMKNMYTEFMEQFSNFKKRLINVVNELTFL